MKMMASIQASAIAILCAGIVGAVAAADPSNCGTAQNRQPCNTAPQQKSAPPPQALGKVSPPPEAKVTPPSASTRQVTLPNGATVTINDKGDIVAGDPTRGNPAVAAASGLKVPIKPAAPGLIQAQPNAVPPPQAGKPAPTPTPPALGKVSPPPALTQTQQKIVPPQQTAKPVPTPTPQAQPKVSPPTQKSPATIQAQPKDIPPGPASPPAYSFLPTAYGTVQILQDGKTIATSMPEFAAQQYGYKTPPSPLLANPTSPPIAQHDAFKPVTPGSVSKPASNVAAILSSGSATPPVQLNNGLDFNTAGTTPKMSLPSTSPSPGSYRPTNTVINSAVVAEASLR